MRKSLWIMPAVLFVVIAAPYAQADIITFDVSVTVPPFAGGASCPASGCTLSGTIVIDNAAGTVISADVTMSGETPLVGPFISPQPPVLCCSSPFGPTIQINDATNTFSFFLTPEAPATLVGYMGGPISNSATGVTNINLQGSPDWAHGTGSLTPVATPEPGSAGLMLLGVGLVFVMRKRNSRGHQLAT